MRRNPIFCPMADRPHQKIHPLERIGPRKIGAAISLLSILLVGTLALEKRAVPSQS
ncbi:MAG: hypothetical protein HY644_03500 [Acidobacteria bacterium]|nr:hypothetical protein [Acidobacteriota bacterium]